ncbi:CHAP domain-containing protein [Enterococcus sp. BWT-B8]|uniref:CHAP domain-containing protein n=1 Tax=unclassified Enterococcus TaxID=2608891 RepID=UPI001E59933D|nr:MULTISPECIES: CHAP domain-containing protein [unclassified Enterococcus]MCB5951949.1 CHAP domain-containing protein [Enterococcus sp. BWT-B8]MCB5954145.1 CHAP domain-containing protein [Enterococcus sp. CWB-B31]
MTTQAQGLQWINNSIGKTYDFDGFAGAQCFDLINSYAFELFSTSFPGAGAIDLLSTGNRAGFKVINQTVNSYPKPGDIFIMEIYGSQWGHTGLILSADTAGMWVVDQNFKGTAPTINYPAEKRYIKYLESYGKLAGWIHPPFSSSLEEEDGTKKNTKMQCFFRVTNESLVHYFDGKRLTPIGNPDEINILNDIYKANNGKAMPSFVLDKPWFVRLSDVAKRNVLI